MSSLQGHLQFQLFEKKYQKLLSKFFSGEYLKLKLGSYAVSVSSFYKFFNIFELS